MWEMGGAWRERRRCARGGRGSCVNASGGFSLQDGEAQGTHPGRRGARPGGTQGGSEVLSVHKTELSVARRVLPPPK